MTVKLSKRRTGPGFTLLELLVVIGIIAVLVGLLFPAIAVVQNASYAAGTQSRIAGLIQAIQQYQQQFTALPGPIPNSVIDKQINPTIAGGTPLYIKGTSTPIVVTSSQNLTLGLLGGLGYTAAPAAFYYDSTTLGRGPLCLNVNNPTKQYMPSMDNATGRTAVASVTMAATGENLIPDFMDAYPVPMPILYLRANQGMTTAIDAAIPSAAQYSLNELAPYHPAAPAPTLFCTTPAYAYAPFNFATNAGDATGWPGSYTYFVSASTGVVHQKDGYILIAAGKSRVYGNNDNITSFGVPGQ